MELRLVTGVARKEEEGSSVVDAAGRPERGSVMPLCRVCTVSMNTNEMENTNLNLGIKGDELKNAHVIKDLRRKLGGEIERVSIETLGWPTACAQWHRAGGNREWKKGKFQRERDHCRCALMENWPSLFTVSSVNSEARIRRLSDE